MPEPLAQQSRPAMSGASRRDRIVRDLEQTGFVSARELTEELGVSEMTVRRDLRRLEQEGALRIVHGGASLPIGIDYQSRGMSEQAAKADIGRYAASLIPPGSTVLMDAGTTVAQVAQHMPANFDGYVITHSVPVIESLLERPEIPVHCLGGELRAQSRAMIGTSTVESLSKLRAQVLFLGAAAVNERGVFVAKDFESSTKRAFIESSDRVILLADHSKFSTFTPVLLAPLSVVHEIVTDRPLPAHMARVADELRIAVHVVNPA